ncbi:MAG: ferredoxin [Candidatus Altiarchaeota archaeon]
MAKKYIIKQTRDACIGCGACEAVCPENWKMMEDGKAKPVKTELDELGRNRDAEENCPVACIKIIVTE